VRERSSGGRGFGRKHFQITTIQSD
jgi:hypothetical protein